MAFNPQISVALVTRNRPESLLRTLKSLRAQSIQPYEVIISDDSSTTENQKATAKLASDYECLYTQGPKRGLYANRNFVALLCKGTHIRTMDDDHTFPDDHFAVVNEWVQRKPTDVLTIGEFLPSEIPTPSYPPPIPGQLHPRGKSMPPEKLDDYYGISCGGSVYPREIFDKGYRLEDTFLFGSSYLEFGSLLKFKGQRINFIDETYLIHHFENADLRRPEIVIPCLVWALLCHSFYYRPEIQNKRKTLYKFAIFLLTRNFRFIYDLKQGYQAFRRRVMQVRNLPRLDYGER